MRRSIRTAICTGLALLLLILMLKQTSLQEVRGLLRGFTIGRLGVALAILLASYLVRGLLWQTMLKPVKEDLRFANALSGYILSTSINNLLPFRLGELARAALIKRQERVKLPAALAAIAAERVIDLSTFAALILTSSLLLIGPGGYPIWLRSILILIGALLVAWLMAVAMASRWEKGPSSLLTRLPTRLRGCASLLTSHLMEGATGIARHPRYALRAVALSSLSGLLQISFVALYFDSGGYELPIPAYVFGGLTATLVASVPLTLGNVGTYEAAFAAAFSLLGVEPQRLLPLILAMHLTQLVVISLAGAVVLLGGGLHLKAPRIIQPSSETSA
jgi:uncharacterized protein (TIRG00374 family)